VPEFAVEFDVEAHEHDRVRRRDALKDSICERLGLPLLRIDRFGLRPTIRRTVIWYLVESWALWCGFSEAQDEWMSTGRELSLEVSDGRWRDAFEPATIALDVGSTGRGSRPRLA
jgi:hypothetical protein